MATATAPCQSPHIKNVSPDRQRFLHWLSRLNFGRIENLAVHNGEPCKTPETRAYRTVKLGRGENAQDDGQWDYTPWREGDDRINFLLKTQVIRLFALFDGLRNGTIAELEVCHGLPFRVTVAEPLA